MSRNKNRPNRYTPEFRAQAKGLAREVGPSKAASDLGMPEQTLKVWLWRENQASGQQGQLFDASLAPEEELRKLRKENEELKKANWILKQAAAFFSQDHLK
jgi:transposase-like protein